MYAKNTLFPEMNTLPGMEVLGVRYVRKGALCRVICRYRYQGQIHMRQWRYVRD